MKITVYNFKGGVGKTSISLNTALTLGYGIITNDIYSPLEKVLESEKLLKLEIDQDIPDFPNDYNIIFDLGGHIDKRAIKALSISDYVIVPTTSNFLDLQVTINAIAEIEEYNKNIIIVGNMMDGAGQDVIDNVIKAMGYDYPIAYIKRSAAIKNLCSNKSSIADITKKGGLQAYHYKKIKEQFDVLIKLLK